MNDFIEKLKGGLECEITPRANINTEDDTFYKEQHKKLDLAVKDFLTRHDYCNFKRLLMTKFMRIPTGGMIYTLEVDDFWAIAEQCMPKEALENLRRDYDVQMEWTSDDRRNTHISIVHKERPELIEKLRYWLSQEPTYDEMKKALSGINAPWLEQLKREAYISGQSATQDAYKHAFQGFHGELD